jgi:hypothetical protein
MTPTFQSFFSLSLPLEAKAASLSIYKSIYLTHTHISSLSFIHSHSFIDAFSVFFLALPPTLLLSLLFRNKKVGFLTAKEEPEDEFCLKEGKRSLEGASLSGQASGLALTSLSFSQPQRNMDLYPGESKERDIARGRRRRMSLQERSRKGGGAGVS